MLQIDQGFADRSYMNMSFSHVEEIKQEHVRKHILDIDTVEVPIT